MKLQKLTRGSFLSALGVALMYFASLSTTLSLTIIAVAGMIPAIAHLHCGRPYGLMVFVVISLLTSVLIPDKGLALMYITFFGSYPILKNRFDGISAKPLRWALKLMYFNAVFYALWFMARALVFGTASGLPVFLFIAQLAMNLFFIVFDNAAGKILSQLTAVIRVMK